MSVDGWAGLDDDGRAFLNEALGAPKSDTDRHDSPPLNSPLGFGELPPPVDAAAEANAELAELLNITIQSGASDLHLGVDVPPHIRVKGALRPLRELGPLGPDVLERLLLSPLSQEQQSTLRSCGDLDLAIESAGSTITPRRFRASIFRQSGSYAGAFRVVAQEIPSIQGLGLPPAIQHLADLTHGLVLITGKTGSGKSTTLAAMIEHINQTRADHIITIEDPIEYRYQQARSVIQQREVGVDTSSFSSALRHALRQDPDVILIGELRDLDTIRTALTAAETGHLVLATLHSSDTAGALTRVIDVFPGDQQAQIRSQLALSLRGIATQQLVPTTSGGLLPATEILIANVAARNLIREDKLHQLRSLLETGGEEGMRTFDQSLALLVRQGHLTHEAALGASRDQANLSSLVTP